MKFTCTTCNSNNTHHIPIASCNNFLHCMKKIVKETEKIDEKRKRIRDTCKEDFYLHAWDMSRLTSNFLSGLPCSISVRTRETHERQWHNYMYTSHYNIAIAASFLGKDIYENSFTFNQHACYSMWIFFSPRKSTYLPVLLHLIIISLILIPLNF